MPQLCSKASDVSLWLGVKIKILPWPARPHTVRVPSVFQMPCPSSLPSLLQLQPQTSQVLPCLRAFLLADPSLGMLLPEYPHGSLPRLLQSFFLKKKNKQKTSQWRLLWPPYLKLYPLTFLIHLALLYYSISRTFRVISFSLFIVRRAEVVSVLFTDKPQTSRTVLGTWQIPTKDSSTIKWINESVIFFRTYYVQSLKLQHNNSLIRS